MTASDTPGVATDRRITIDVYSDVVCPWCYIGKRRFEAGVDLVRDELAAAAIELDVVYRPFQLDPTAPPGVATPVAEGYARKFGGPERAAQIIDHVTSVAAECGLAFRMDRAVRANTLLAHRLIWWAGQLADRSAVTQVAMKERLLAAYFVDGLDVGDVETLADCAADVGIERAAALAFLESDAGLDEVRAELDEARDEGITAVPTYVLNRTWAVPGAQDPETFAQVIRKMAAAVSAS